MAVTPGSRVGQYEIVSAIGAGGMGEVYRARDARLNRDVALKVLPDAFSLDLTRDPRTFIAFHQRLAIKNVSDPDPPAVFRFLFGTHPSTVERLGMGEAYER